MSIPKWKYQQKIDGKRKHIYCSKECTDKANTKKSVKICEQCGKEFEVSNCFKDIQRFCSRECYEESRKKRYICPICGNEFDPKTKYQIYCSDTCKQKAGIGTSTVFCDYCGKPITRNNYEIYSHKKHYCSKECRANDLYWNLDDLNLLRKYFGNIDIANLRQKLSKDRSFSEIIRKAHQLGISTDLTWSKQEDQILLDNYSNMSVCDICKLLPNRTASAIKSHAQSMGLLSYFSKTRFYTDEEIDYLRNNYLKQDDYELAQHLGRTTFGIIGKLRSLGLSRPIEIKKDGYYDLIKFMRSRLSFWREDVLKEYNYTCFLTGATSNLVAHHIYGFNLIFEETVDALNFPLYDDFTQYTDDELYLFVETFFDIQEYYHSYVCISEDIHRLFHKIYGYGNNTPEQWEEFVNNYKGHCYDNVA